MSNAVAPGEVRLLAAIFGLGAEERLQLLDRSGFKRPRCLYCNKPLPVVTNVFIAIHQRKYCNSQCARKFRHRLTQATYTCAWCGRSFQRQKSSVRSNNVFCSRQCVGRRAGREYGFLAHPENVHPKKLDRKWDWQLVWAKHLETGLGARRLGRLLGIPEGTVTAILRKMRRAKA